MSFRPRSFTQRYTSCLPSHLRNSLDLQVKFSRDLDTIRDAFRNGYIRYLAHYSSLIRGRDPVLITVEQHSPESVRWIFRHTHYHTTEMYMFAAVYGDVELLTKLNKLNIDTFSSFTEYESYKLLTHCLSFGHHDVTSIFLPRVRYFGDLVILVMKLGITGHLRLIPRISEHSMKDEYLIQAILWCNLPTLLDAANIFRISKFKLNMLVRKHCSDSDFLARWDDYLRTLSGRYDLAALGSSKLD